MTRMDGSPYLDEQRATAATDVRDPADAPTCEFCAGKGWISPDDAQRWSSEFFGKGYQHARAFDSPAEDAVGKPDDSTSGFAVAHESSDRSSSQGVTGDRPAAAISEAERLTARLRNAGERPAPDVTSLSPAGLPALIAQWRQQAKQWPNVSATPENQPYADGRAKSLNACADALEALTRVGETDKDDQAPPTSHRHHAR